MEVLRAMVKPGKVGRLLVFRLVFWWVSTGLALVSLSTAGGEAGEALEYKVKAGYLFNFAKFIEWPKAVLSAEGGPFVIGVMDGGEVLAVIRQVLEEKKINGQRIEIKSVAPTASTLECHLLFVPRSAGRAPADLAAQVGKASILVVGETERFAESGGMIGFVREADSVRLNLNLDAATEAGLKVSAKLSSVARLVKGSRKGE